MEMPTEFTRSETGKYGPWAMGRDVLQMAMSHGQLPSILLTIITVVMIRSIPPQQLAEIVKIVASVVFSEYSGYSYAFLIAVSWFIHVKALKGYIEVKKVASHNSKN